MRSSTGGFGIVFCPLGPSRPGTTQRRWWRTPIQQALCDPERFDGPSRKLDFTSLRSLDFEPVDTERFPAILLAHRVIEAGGDAGAVFNAANEVAVEAFLARRIPFLAIPEIVRETLDAEPVCPITSLDDVLAADRRARVRAADAVDRRADLAPNTAADKTSAIAKA